MPRCVDVFSRQADLEEAETKSKAGGVTLCGKGFSIETHGGNQSLKGQLLNYYSCYSIATGIWQAFKRFNRK